LIFLQKEHSKAKDPQEISDKSLASFNMLNITFKVISEKTGGKGKPK